MTHPLDDPPRPPADDESPLDFGRVPTRATLPPPPRPAVLDSLAPVDFRAEEDVERRRVGGLRRRRAAARVAGVAFGAGVALSCLVVIFTLDRWSAPGAPPRVGAAAAPAGIAQAPADEVARPAAGPQPPVSAPSDVAPRAEAPPAASAPADPPTPTDAPAPGSVAAATPEPAPPRARPRAAEAPRPRPGPASALGPARDRLVSDDPSRPVVPDRDAVRVAMESVRARVEACAAGLPGVARLVVTVSPDGRVRHAQVQGGFAGRPEGTCMARVVRDARFPAFRKADFRVAYPYALGE